MSRCRMLLAVLLTAAVVGVPATPVQASPAPSPQRPAATWAGLRLPYLTEHAAHFGRNRMPLDPGRVLATTTTLDAAYLLLRTRSGRAVLVELLARRGPSRVVAHRVQGLPIGDSSGHLVTWTAARGEGARLFALDSRTGTVLRGPAVSPTTRVYALEAGRAYVTDVLEDPVGQVRTWAPRVGPGLLPGPRSVLKSRRYLLDVHEGSYLVTSLQEDYTSLFLGAVSQRLRHTELGEISPSGRYVADSGINEGWVWDTRTRRSIRLTGVDRPFSARWSPTGALVVSTSTGSFDDIESIRTHDHVCRPPGWRCRPLPDGNLGFVLQQQDGTGAAQLLATLFTG